MMETIKEFRNDLLKRKEVLLSGEYQGNPGVEKSVVDVASHFSTKEENIVVRTLMGNFGSSSFLVDAFVYDSVADKEKFEPKKKEKKKTGR